MKRVILVVLFLLSINSTSAWAFEMFQVGIGPYGRRTPAIYEDIVVYPCDKHGGYGIYGYDLSEHTEFEICILPDVYRWAPDVYENIVVWEDERSGNKNIFGFDLNRLGEEGYEGFQITDDSYDQTNPRIWGDYVIWGDTRNDGGDIYGYNLTTGEEFPVVNGYRNQWNHEIQGNLIVWEDGRYFNGYSWWGGPGTIEVYGAYINPDGTIGEEFEITEHDSFQRSPNVWGNTVIWSDDRDGSYDIWAKNLDTDDEYLVSSTPGTQWSQVMNERYIIWNDSSRHANWDICGYDRLTGEEFYVTDYPTWQWLPDLYGNVVVWEEYLDGIYWGTYGAIIPEPSTIILLTTGLFGVVGLGLKRRR